MVRKFGTSSTNRVGTGTVLPTESGTEKWAGSVAAQVTTAANIKTILAKTIPVDYVVCDQENPRKLALTQEQITIIATTYPFDKNQLQIDDPADWIEDARYV